MLCQNCHKKAATLQYVQYINGKKTDIYLCEECAKVKGYIGNDLGLDLNDFLSSLIELMHADSSYKDKGKEKALPSITCDKCGMSFEEFQKNGRLGCSDCYNLYQNNLDFLLRRIQGGSIEHTGKTPKTSGQLIRNNRELKTLRELLKKAVQEEEYEEAVILRDKIRSIEGQQSGQQETK